MEHYLKTKDFSVTQEAFDLEYDANLDMLRTTPVPENLARYYESEAYISHTDGKQGLLEKVYQAVKKITLSQKLALIKRHLDVSGSLLDVGAGTGDFLVHAQTKEYTVLGVEPNGKARQLAQEKGINVVEQLSQLPADQQYHCITLWHVLEHLPHLEADILALTQLLLPNGVLIVAVPNYKSWDAQHYGPYWAAYDVPRHLWHFSKQSIDKLFGSHGFEVVQTKGMFFDPFYVSLLSEKYSCGKQRFLPAVYNGLRSWFHGSRHGEHSSHIYVLKRTKDRK